MKGARIRARDARGTEKKIEGGLPGGLTATRSAQPEGRKNKGSGAKEGSGIRGSFSLVRGAPPRRGEHVRRGGYNNCLLPRKTEQRRDFSTGEGWGRRLSVLTVQKFKKERTLNEPGRYLLWVGLSGKKKGKGPNEEESSRGGGEKRHL